MKKILILLLALNVYLNAETLNPDAIYENVKYEYILNKDGSIEFDYEHSLRYLSYFSINHLLGESFIVYNPDFQTLEITKSETIMANGDIVKAPFNSFNEVLPNEASKAPGYFNLREMVVTHTGLERNCLVNFGYKIITKAGILPGLFGDVVIGGHHPIKKMEIVIKVPKGQKLNLFMANNGPMGKVSEVNDFDVYKWELKNIPMFPVESNQPDFKEYLPTLYFSTVEISKIIENIVKNRELYILDDKSKLKVKEIISDKFTFLDKIKALQEYVSLNISGANLDLNLIGLRPQSAQKTLERGSGSYLDKAILLKAMCDAVNINSELAFASGYSTEKPDLTLLSEFKVFLVNCKSDDGVLNVLLDPNIMQMTLVPETIYNKAIFSLADEKVYLIKPFETKNLSNFQGKVNFSDLKLNSKYVATGEYVEDIDINSFDQKINSYLTSHKFELDKELSSGQFLFNQFEKIISCKIIPENYTDEIVKLVFPPIPGSFNEEHLNFIPTSRITPVKLKRIFNEEYQVIINMDNTDKKLINPIEISEDNSVGSVEIVIRENGNSIEFKRKLKFKKRFIDPKDYYLLYKIISYWDDDKYRYVYLK